MITAKTIEAVIDEDRGGSIDVFARPGAESVIEFPAEIPLQDARFSIDGFQVEQTDNGASIKPHPKIPVNTVAHVRLRANNLTIVAIVHITDGREHPVTGHITVVTRTEAERRREQDAAVRRQAVRDMLRARAQQMRQPGQFRPIQEPTAVDDTQPLAVRVRGAEIVGKFPEQYLLIPVDLTGRDPRAYRLATLTATDRYQNSLTAEIVEVSSVRRTDTALAVVAERAKARIYIAVQLDEEDIVPSLRMVLNEPDGLRPVLAAVVFTKITLEEDAQNRRNAERVRELERELEERERIAEQARRAQMDLRRLSIGLQLLGGAIWLEDGIDNTETRPTSMMGLGVRFTRGMTQFLGIEVDLAGATSGNAEFVGIPIDGMDGDLTRSAKFGRVRVGGTLRFGDKITPNLRLGLGLQAVRHTTAAISPGIAPPSSSTDVDGLWFFGAGIDARIDKTWTAGISTSFSKLASSESRALDLGVYVSYQP